MLRPWYATREQVKAAPDLKHTARDNDQIDRAIDTGSRAAEQELRRRFYPQLATYTFPAPRRRTLHFDEALDVDLVALETLTIDGATIAPSDRDLLPVDGPPFSRIELAESVGCGTGRRPVQASGTWGYDDLTGPAGALAADVPDQITTTVDVTDSALVGVGTLLTIGAEKLLVAGKTLLDTGQTLQADLTASTANTTVNVADGSTFPAGDVIQIDSERMLIEAVAGNALTVKRQWDGTVLADHTTGAVIFAPRRLTVRRGVLGTTASSHTAGAAAARQLYPPPVVSMTVALAVVQVLQETGGYAQTSDEDNPRERAGRGLQEARRRAAGLRRILLG